MRYAHGIQSHADYCTRAVSNAFKVSLKSPMAQYLLSRFSLQV